jgi:hypothetical protein
VYSREQGSFRLQGLPIGKKMLVATITQSIKLIRSREATYNNSPLTFAKGVTVLTLPVACKAIALS